MGLLYILLTILGGVLFYLFLPPPLERRRDAKLQRLPQWGRKFVAITGLLSAIAGLLLFFEELHNQYSLGYVPINTRWDGVFRRIEIRPSQKDYRVYARMGYYATPRGK